MSSKQALLALAAKVASADPEPPSVATWLRVAHANLLGAEHAARFEELLAARAWLCAAMLLVGDCGCELLTSSDELNGLVPHHLLPARARVYMPTRGLDGSAVANGPALAVAAAALRAAASAL